MELTQLYQFKIAAECGQLKKAADSLYISSPALSKSIKKLEEEFGQDLFIRTKAGIELTDFGREFLGCANNIFQITDEMKRIAERYSSSASKTITIASDVPASIRYLMPLFYDAHPEIDSISYFLNSQELMEQIRSQKIDIAISAEKTEDKSLYCYPLGQERNFLYIPNRNPLSKQKYVYVSDLKGQTLARIDEYSYFYEVFDRLKEKTNTKIYFKMFRDYITYNTFKEKGSDTLCLFTANNLSTMYNPAYPNRKIVYFKDKELTYNYYIIYHKDNIKTVKPFIDWLNANYKTLFSKDINLQ